MTYDQAPYWLWPLDRWKLLVTIVLALLLLLVSVMKQPLSEASTAPILQNPVPEQSFIEGDLIVISGVAGIEQVVQILLCPVDVTEVPNCSVESTHPLAETTTDVAGSWQVIAPPLSPGKHAVVVVTRPDDAVQTLTSSAVVFKIEAASPIVTAPSFDSPNRDTLLTQPIELTGQASAGNAVFLFADATFLGRTYADSKGLWRFEAPQLGVGTHLIVAKVLAPNGEVLGASEPLVILVVPES